MQMAVYKEIKKCIISDESFLAGQGCYLDNPNNPDLPHEQSEPVPNPDVRGPLPSNERGLPVFSPDACVQTCKARGFKYAATKVRFRSLELNCA